MEDAGRSDRFPPFHGKVSRREDLLLFGPEEYKEEEGEEEDEDEEAPSAGSYLG